MLILGTAGLAGCADDAPTDPGSADASATAAAETGHEGTQVMMEPDWVTLEGIGVSGRLAAAVVDASGKALESVAVTWESADDAIATVDSTGLVTSVGYGITEITATSGHLTGIVVAHVTMPLSDREILEILYRETGGEDWTTTTNWLSGEPLDQWFGVEADDSGNVTHLSLGENNLVGSIPLELAGLGDLSVLDVRENSLTGPVPSDLGALKQVRDLLLSDNELEGPLPGYLGFMTGLRYLDIGTNNLTGAVPGAFGRLELDTLYTSGSGVCLPPSLDEWHSAIDRTDTAAHCAAKLFVDLIDLPSPNLYAVGETATLSATYVSVEGDTTLGPAAAWSSGDATIVSVHVSSGEVTAVSTGEAEVTATYDSLTASIGVEVILPENDREVLAVLYDRARGDDWTDGTDWLTEEPLSEWAGVETDDSDRVVSLSLRDNNLRGPLHASIGQLDRLTTLDLGLNWITGPIPAEMANLTLLRKLTLSVNGLVGELPPGLGALDSLRDFRATATSLSGRVPAAFAELDLESFQVSATALCVPPSLAAWLDSIPSTDNPPVCTSRVSVGPASINFRQAGDTTRLSVTVTGPEGNVVDSPAVIWASADTAVATVDSAGLVTAVATGATTVAATYDSVSTGASDITVVGSDREILEILFHETSGEQWTDTTNWMSNKPLDEWYGVHTRNGRVTLLTLGNSNLTGPIPAAIALLDSLELLDLHANALTGPIPSALERLRNLGALFLDNNTGLTGPPPPGIGKLSRLRNLFLGNTGLTGPIPASFADLKLERFFTQGTGLCLQRSLAAWHGTIAGTSEALPCIPDTADRKVLVTLYNGTGGGHWTSERNWLSGGVNAWEGITTDEDGFVTGIALVNNNMTGSIPPELGRLAKLTTLNLGRNSLSDSIPSELGDLASLATLSLEGNALAGEIPSALSRLANASLVSLAGNRLAGPIPPELGSLANLTGLWLNNNELTGTVPTELSNLAKLEVLNLADNELDGAIPTELGTLAALQGLDLAGNEFTGAIPTALGQLATLEVLRLADNRFSGGIPTELGALSRLRRLDLSRSGLTGAIPSSLGQLETLVELVLAGNSLSGSIPAEFGKLYRLRWLDLSRNNLTGAIPSALGKLSALEELRLAGNRLSMEIPEQLGTLYRLQRLDLSSNSVSGAIPPELTDLSSLSHLVLDHNALSGSVPFDIGDLSRLQVLRLEANPQLTGLLPRSLMDLADLAVFRVDSTGLCPHLDARFENWLDGFVEDTVPGGGRVDQGLDCGAAEIERLALSEFFALTGGDSWTNSTNWGSDSTVGSWHGVTVGDSLVHRLVLAENALAGPLPAELTNLRELRTLDLGGNSLTGAFPVAITSMASLDTISIRGNTRMEGPLPAEMTNLTDLMFLRYDSTGLCAPPSTTFRNWLREVGGAEDDERDYCGGADSVRVSLPVVYLTQAIQRPAGDVPLVAGRQALLRVFLTADRENAFFDPYVKATFTRGREVVDTAVLTITDNHLPTSVYEGDLSRSFQAVIPGDLIADSIEMVVEVDSAGLPLVEGSETRFPEAGRYALEVVETPPLELTVVPILYAEDPDSSVLDWTSGITADSPQVALFRHSFPVSEFSATDREPHITSIDPVEDQWSLLSEIEVAYNAEEATGYWYAVADSPDGYVRGLAWLNGWVSLGKPWDTELAHEVGHNLDLLHAPCGGALGTDPDFPHELGSIGAWGYDFRDGSALHPIRRRDIMGYCYDRGWLSDYYFERVLEVREEKEGGGAAARRLAAGAKVETLVVSGGVRDGEPRIEPLHSMFMRAKLPDRTGPYRLEGLRRDGEMEFSLSFTPGEDKYGNKYFFFAVPIEADWEDLLERITLTGPEGEVTVDQNDPRSLTIVTDPATGRIRAILRDWNQALPSALGDTAGLEVVTTRGIVEAVRLVR
ncbi:MAG: Ig-like domain-containing protein [Gemmatimonadota bacterium]|nr:Ig-like domain-containing protein [Gemmatimonadota bacterium]